MEVIKKSGLFLISLILTAQISAQTLEGECIRAGFGIDAYTYANGTAWINIGTPVNRNDADDWFYDPAIYDGIGRGVIDVSNAAYYQALLQSGANIQFYKKMSVPPNSIINGRRWQDATYIRDFYGGIGTIDSTSFFNASKNGEPLESWSTGLHNVTPKNDLIDCFAHLRRDGSTSENPLWLYLGFSRISNSGESYFDAELFANEIFYDHSNGFQPVGPDEGHNAWQFDAAGNITDIGDMIVSVVMNTDNIPEFEIRVWVSRNDFENVDPTTFDFGVDIDGASVNSTYGYADILPPIGVDFGCGETNKRPWPSTPWGTLDDHGDFSTEYEPGQFVEIGLNLYEFGIDPQLITGLDACAVPFSNLIFKARASASFTAQLKDFSGPFTFVALDFLESHAIGDSITCIDPIINLQVENPYPDAFYEWSTEDGNILTNLGSINDTIIYVDQAGTYILTSAYMNDCELSFDTIVVNDYSHTPPVTILSDPITDCRNLVANLSVLEDGYVYRWAGPNGSSFFGQNITVTEPGAYYLQVFNQYGCMNRDSIYVLDFPCQEIDSPIQTTTYIDDIPPFFTAPPDVSIECYEDPLDLGITGDVVNERENCEPRNIQAVFTDDFTSSGFCNGTGLINRTWSLTDQCGNNLTLTQEIHLVDTEAPLFNSPEDITINCDDDYNDLNLTGLTPIPVDSCDNLDISIQFTDQITEDFDCEGQTLVSRIWSAMDNCGNIALDTQFILMIDTVAPQLVGIELTPIVSCDSVPPPPTVTALDNCDSDPVIQFYENQRPGDCPNLYIITRTWRAGDNCGNLTIFTQEIHVEDTEDPVILSFPGNTTISCDSVPPPGNPQIEDNCDIQINLTFDEQVTQSSCEGSYQLERTWTWLDDCNNEASATQIISVIDNTPPTFDGPEDVTVSCILDIENLINTGDATNEDDNCTSTVEQATFADDIQMQCSGTGVVYRTWSLLDNCDNLTEYIQTITIIDTVPPILSVPQDIAIQCDQNPNDLTITGQALAQSDNCDQNLGTVTHQDVISQSPDCISELTITRTWSLSDDCGNTAEHVQIIQIIDTVPPVFSAPSDITIDCNTDYNDLTLVGEVPIAEDNCDQNLGNVEYNDLLVLDGYCDGSGRVERTWTITDECGNTNSQLQIIAFIDTIAPTFILPEDVTLDCTIDPTNLNFTGDVSGIIDNCDIALGNVQYADSIIQNTPCEGSAIIYRTWSLSDDCGNSTTGIQVLTFADTTAPIILAPVDLTIDCHALLSELDQSDEVTLVIEDCSSNLGQATFMDQVLRPDSCDYLIQRIWSLEDACGNIGLDTQLIAIKDTIPPIFDNFPTTVNESCDTIPPAPLLTATDNCDDDVSVILVENIIPGNCDNNYTINRIWTATDKCGNSISISQNVEVLDFADPVILEFPADITASCELIPAVEPIDVEDNCDANITLIFSETIVPGNCNNNYEIIRTWEWVDNCNNNSSHSQTITIIDQTGPEFNAPEDVTIDCTTDINDLVFTGDVTGVSDNCDEEVTSISYSDFSTTTGLCDGNMLIRRTWTLTDSCGNSLSDLQVITVIDTLVPFFMVPDDITLSCGQNPDDINLTGDATGETDLCASSIGDAIFIDSIANNIPCEGSQIIYRTWSLSDDCGNEFSAIQTITIQDDKAPVFISTANDTIVECDAIPPVINPTVIDSCNSTFNIDFSENIIQGSCPNDFVLQRIWRAIDDCGNQDSVVQTITVVDNTAPFIISFPNDTTVFCDAVPAIPVLEFEDTCSDSVYVDFQETNSPGVCINIQQIERTWTLTDNCGNQSTYAQVITLHECGPDVSLDLPPYIPVCENEPVLLESNLSAGYPTPFYQWQFTQDTLATWIDIPGATAASYNIATLTENESGYYQLIVADQLLNLGDSLCSILSDKVFIAMLEHAPITLLSEEICDGDTLMFHSQPLFQSGIYQDTLTAFNGCDSVVQMDLGILPIYTNNALDTVCAGESVMWGDSIFSVTGSYSFLFQTIDGCDSLVLLDLIVRQPVITNLSDQICDGDSVMFASQGYVYQSGSYSDTLSARNGCDSVVILDLTVHPNFQSLENAIICAGDEYVIGDSIFTETGFYSYTFTTVNGCDSLFEINLVVLEENRTDLESQICEGDSIPFGSAILFLAGNYADTLTAANGCDSIIHLALNLLPEYNHSFSGRICEGEEYSFADTLLTEGGVYNFELETIDGCDSLVELTLLIDLPFELNLQESICEGDSISFNGQILFNQGIYIDSLQSAQGCDSLIIMNLTTLPTYRFQNTVSICVGSEYVIGDSTYTEPGVYNYTFTTVNGCDSIIELQLFVLDQVIENLTTRLCDGDSISFANQTITSNGQYRDTLTSVNGCDSIVILDVSILPVYDQRFIESFCAGDSLTFGDTILTAPGIYNFEYQTYLGCDSLIELTLIENQNYTINRVDQICEGDSVLFNGQTLFQQGQYIDSLLTTEGCDSIIIFDLSVHPKYLIQNTVSICVGSDYVIGDSTYTESGVYNYTFVTINGCDSLVELELFVLDEITENINAQFCEGDSIQFANTTITSGGQYQDTLSSINGCDSIVILDVSILPNYDQRFIESFCAGDSLIFGDTILTAPGIYNFSHQTFQGCDSLIELTIIENQTYTNNFTDQICEGDSVLFNGQIFFQQGQYIDSLLTIDGCDSIIIFDLLVHPKYLIQSTVSICVGSDYIIGDSTYTETGVYNYTFTTVNGCDSLVELELLVVDAIHENVSESICQGDTIIFGNIEISQVGQYQDTLISVNGCDSIVILDLNLIPHYEIFNTGNICNGESYAFGDSLYTETGIYTFTYQSIWGCDSIVHLNLEARGPIMTRDVQSICEGDSITFNDATIFTPGQYTDTLQAFNGCDSIILLDLILNPQYEENRTVNLCANAMFNSIAYFNDTLLIDSLLTYNGCDSIINTMIFVVNEITDTLDLDLCSGQDYLGQTYTSDTILIYNGISFNGCDSTNVTNIYVEEPRDSSIYIEICEGDTIVIGTTSFHQSGNFSAQLQATNGCDSMISLTLVVWPRYEFTIVENICSGEVVNGTVYTENTTITDSLTTINGCDSILTLEINVYDPNVNIVDIQLCVGSSYNGFVYTNDSILVDSLIDFRGCDSILIENIFVVTDIQENFEYDLCFGENWNGELFLSDTSFTNTYLSFNGCDSTVTNTIFIQPIYQDTFNYEICEGETITLAGVERDQSGEYVEQSTTVFGCDSIIVNYLLVNPIYEEISEFDICQGDSLMIFGNLESTSGQYILRLESQDGCDSILVTNLNVLIPEITNQTAYLCDGDTIQFGNQFISTTGNYIDTLTNQQGCDSIIILDLQIIFPIATAQSLELCEGDSVLFAGQYYASSGVFTDTLTTYLGCDSIVSLDLEVHPVFENSREVIICEGEGFFAAGILQTESGIYIDRFTSINGCDSIWSTELSVNPIHSIELEYNFCDGESFFVAGNNQTQSGTFTEVFENQFGCDSTVITKLNFHQNYNTIDNITICDTDSILINGVFQNQSGLFTDSLTSFFGCDSIISIALTVTDEQAVSYSTLTICEGDSIFINGSWESNGGVFIETFNTNDACDSLEVITLNVQEPNLILSENAEICFGDETQLFLEGAEQVDNITWYPDVSLSCGDCPNPIAFPETTTIYTVTYPSGCDDEMLETQVEVIVYEPTDVETIETEINMIEGDTITLMVADVDSNFIYSWQDGYGNTLCDTCTSVMVFPNSAVNNYYVTAIDPSHGCPGIANSIAFVERAPCINGNFRVSNVIFPQSNGYGDHFEIEHEGVDLNVLRIYNRWGEMVFETYDMDQKWDGTFRGELLNPGVYVYYLLGNCQDALFTKFVYTGNITLIH